MEKENKFREVMPTMCYYIGDAEIEKGLKEKTKLSEKAIQMMFLDSKVKRDYLYSNIGTLIEWRDYYVRLLQHCKNKNPKNLHTYFEAEVEDFVKDVQGQIKAVKLKDGRQIEGDVFVLCLGPELAKFSWEKLGVLVPIVGVRGYTCNIVPKNP